MPVSKVNGWTVVTPSADSRIVYIASVESGGNDASAAAVYGRGYYLPNDPEIGADPTQPVGAVVAYRNPQEALKKFRGNGAPEWILFRRGDSFPNSIMDGNYTYWGQDAGVAGPTFHGIWRWAYDGDSVSRFGPNTGFLRGRSASEPFVISAWGPVTDPRPVFPSGFGVRHSLWNTVVSSLDVPGRGGLNFENAPVDGYRNTILEDCRSQGHGMIFISGGGPLTSIVMRRCVYTDGWNANGHNSSPYVGLAEGARLTMEECVFDRNGYKENPDAPRTWTAAHTSGLTVGQLPVGTGVQPTRTWFDRNWYLSGSAGSGLRVRGNIASRTGGGGEQFRSGGVAERNLFLFDHDGVSASGAGGSQYGFAPIVVKDNVFLHDDAMLPPGGFGMNNEIRAAGGAYWMDNVIAHNHGYVQNGYGTLDLKGTTDNGYTPPSGWEAVVRNNAVIGQGLKGWGIHMNTLQNGTGVERADVQGNAIAITSSPSWIGASASLSPRASDTIDGNIYLGNPATNLFSRSYSGLTNVVGGVQVTGHPRFAGANTTFAQWQSAGYDPNGQMLADWSAFKAAAGWTDPDRDIVSYMQSIDPAYVADEDVRVDFGCSGPLQDVPQLVRNVVPGSDAQKREVARRFHAFVTFINRARVNRKGAWDSNYTAEAVSNYIRAGFGKASITGEYDTRPLSVLVAEYTIQHGPVASLVLTTQPAGGVSGSLLASQPIVALRDASNLTVSSDNSTQVTVAIQSGTGGTLTGTTTVTVVNGVATFTNLVLTGDPLQSYVLRFSITSPALFVDSSGVSVSTAVTTPVLVDVVTPPVAGFNDGLFTTQPVVVLKDSNNAVVTTDNSTTVTVSITGGTGGVLKGTLTKQSVNGVVTFTDLSLFGDVRQTYTLSFSSTGLQGETSQVGLIDSPVTIQPTQDLTAVRSDVYLGKVHSLDIMGEINRSELLSLRANKTKLVGVGPQDFIVNYRNTILKNRDVNYVIPEDWDVSWSIKSGSIANPNIIGPCFLWIKPEKFVTSSDGLKYNSLTDSSQISTYTNTFTAPTETNKATASYYGLNSFIPVNFDGVDDFYYDSEESGDFVIPTNIDFAIAFVVGTEELNTGTEGVVFSVGRENEDGSFQVIIDETLGGRKVKIQTQAGADKKIITTANNCYSQGESIAVVISRVNDVYEISVNGVPETLTGSVMYDVIASGSGSYIGTTEDAVDDTKKKFLKHDLYELVLLKEIINTPLSSIILDQLEGYFAAKYNIVLPSSHAYKSEPLRSLIISTLQPIVPTIPQVSCTTLSATPSQTSFAGTTGNGTIAIDVENEDCQWNASTASGSWITLGEGAGIGDSSLSFSIAENTGSERTGTITVTSGTASPVSITITQQSSGIVATGGTVTDSGGYRIHTFTTSGDFVVSSGGEMDILVVAGGGAGGGSGRNTGGAGGGGGGGVLYLTGQQIAAGTYSIGVGAGGATGGKKKRGGSGGNSTFGSLHTAVGGGGGGGTDVDERDGSAGGSGGGSASFGNALGGLGTTGQGTRGGRNPTGGQVNYGGGGGGAGQAGFYQTSTIVNTQASPLGKGGDGIEVSISGTPTYYGGGGGASRPHSNAYVASGGLGGGGNAGSSPTTSAAYAPEVVDGKPGAANTGGGGGAGHGDNIYFVYGDVIAGKGGPGGSGIVIVRYAI